MSGGEIIFFGYLVGLFTFLGVFAFILGASDWANEDMFAVFAVLLIVWPLSVPAITVGWIGWTITEWLKSPPESRS